MKYIALLFSASLLTTCAMTADDWKSVGAAIDTTTGSVYRAYDGYQVRQQPNYYQPQPVVTYPWPTY